MTEVLEVKIHSLYICIKYFKGKQGDKIKVLYSTFKTVDAAIEKKKMSPEVDRKAVYEIR